MVDRFDRGRDGARIGYASAMTMLEARDGDRRTYLEIAGVVEERSARATDELRELWRRVVLTVMVSNTDTRATTASSTSTWASGGWRRPSTSIRTHDRAPPT